MAANCNGLAKLEADLMRTLQEGSKIIVVGWKSSNHDEYTKELEDSGKVEFSADRVPYNVAPTTRVLFTKFIGHSDFALARKRAKKAVSHTLEIGELRKILIPLALKMREERGRHQEQETEGEKEKTLAKDAKQNKPKSRKGSAMPTTSGKLSDDEKGKGEAVDVVDKEFAFALEFAEAVGSDPNNTLSKYQASSLIQKHFGAGVRTSRFRHLLEPVVPEGGKKAGQYKMSAQLLQILTTPEGVAKGVVSDSEQYEQEVESEQTLSKIKKLVSSEPSLKKELSNLKRRVSEIEEILNKVAQMKALIKEMEKLGL